MLKNGVWKIIDLGVGKKLKEDNDYCSTFAGTPYTQAPEVINLQPYSLSADIYSLGVIYQYLIEPSNVKPSERALPREIDVQKYLQHGIS